MPDWGPFVFFLYFCLSCSLLPVLHLNFMYHKSHEKVIADILIHVAHMAAEECWCEMARQKEEEFRKLIQH